VLLSKTATPPGEAVEAITAVNVDEPELMMIELRMSKYRSIEPVALISNTNGVAAVA
jgi:hypothetical protein